MKNYITSHILVILSIGSVHSIDLSPRLYQSGPVSNHYDVVEDNEPYIISIHQVPSIEIGTNSNGTLTVNLNRAYPANLTILVESYSNEQLILFSKKKTGIVRFETSTFGDVNLEFETGALVGHAQVVAKVAGVPLPGHLVDDSSAFLSINIYRIRSLSLWIDIVGWIYFIAWSASFYFQCILNYKRQSVMGLSFDFLALNLLGFTFYFIYNYSLVFSETVRNNYFERNKYARIPVEYNDLFFAAHALVLSIFTFCQYFYYQGYRQTVSGASKIFNYCTKGFIGITVLAAIILYILHYFNTIMLLDVVIYLSSVKLAISLLKYSPQAYSNYARKATSGWSIDNILLDLTGGIFSLLQMILIAYDFNEWQSFFGNFTKFGLSVISICFDILFVVQHYILYRYDEDTQNIDAVEGPVISESVLARNDEQ